MTMRLGIFWLLPHPSAGIALLAHATALAQAEAYGDCLTDALSHFDAWEAAKRGRPVLAPVDETIRTLIARAEYEDWPRGRVVYDGAAQSFVVYADRQIFPHAALVRAHFSLSPGVPFRTDPHYRNSKRLLREQSAV